VQRAFLIADMPFMSYTTPVQALDNAVRVMQEGGAMMVKLEGGKGQVGVVEYLARHDIPVCAHLGLKPQSVHKIGGFRVQGRDRETAKRMADDAQALEAAGADIVLLECVPSELGSTIAAALTVPVIGIGAGPDVDGQILVLYDILGVTQGRTPRFVKNFMTGRDSALDGITAYVEDVKQRRYPAEEHCFS
jgi:3-methyl-2-oxobutanoate hydroxymethyltransferase